MTTKVKCPYREDCIDVDSELCKNCLNNRKRSYYKPSYQYPYYWTPYYPNYPYYPYWYTTTTCGTSYYQEASALNPTSTQVLSTQ